METADRKMFCLMRLPRAIFRPARAIALALVVVGAGDSSGQVPQNVKIGKGFAIAYHEGTVLKAAFTGQDADPVPGGKVLVKQFVLKTFRDGDENKVDLIVEAPECVFDRSSYTATSPGTLKVYTPSTNYFIEGEGFQWKQREAGAHLSISNRVRTLIEREGTNIAGRTTAPLTVRSDRFDFESRTEGEGEIRLANYSGNVLVEDSDLKMSCGLLTADIPPAGSKVRKIVAEENVVLTGKDGSRATGKRGVYSAEGDRQEVELTGNPTWSDGQKREAQADTFLLDRARRVVRGTGNAQIRLPRQTTGSSGFAGFANSPAPPAGGPAAAPGNPIVIRAALVTVELPESTNGPVRRVVAETNVVIFSEDDKSRATADRAVYTGSNAVVQLTGTPEWRVGDSLVRGGELSVGLTNRYLKAAPQAYLEMPATAFGPNAGGLGPSRGQGAGTSQTNQMLELTAESLEFVANQAVFRSRVHGRLLDLGTNHGTLDCSRLTVTFGPSNRVTRIDAAGEVRLEEAPDRPGAGLRGRKRVSCDSITADFSPAGSMVEMLVADGGVIAEQSRAGLGAEPFQQLKAARVTVRFFPATNRVETVLAEQNVALRQQGNRAIGARALYRVVGTNEIVEVTGNPIAEIHQEQPSRRTNDLRVTNADVLLWDPKTGKLRCKGPFKIVPVLR